jgi:hypothetical protein
VLEFQHDLFPHHPAATDDLMFREIR